MALALDVSGYDYEVSGLDFSGDMTPPEWQPEQDMGAGFWDFATSAVSQGAALFQQHQLERSARRGLSVPVVSLPAPPIVSTPGFGPPPASQPIPTSPSAAGGFKASPMLLIGAGVGVLALVLLMRR